MDTYGRGSGCEEHRFACSRGLLSGQCIDQQAAGRHDMQLDRQPVEAVKVSAVLVDVTPELVDSPVPAGIAGNDGGTKCMPLLVRQTALEDGLSVNEEVMAGVNYCDYMVGGPTSTFLSGADGIVDLAGDVTVSVSSLADHAEGVTVGVTSPADAGVACLADIAGGVTLGVASLADAGVLSPADLAEVASSSDFSWDITVGMLSPADLAGGVTVGVAPSAVAGVATPADLDRGVTVGVTSLADPGVAFPGDLAEVASSADLAGNVTFGVTFLVDPVGAVTDGIDVPGEV